MRLMRSTLLLLGIAVSGYAETIGTVKVEKQTDTTISFVTTLNGNYKIVGQSTHDPYRIRYNTNPIDVSAVTTVTRSNSWFTVANLKPNTSYFFVIEAYTQAKVGISLKQYRLIGKITANTLPPSASYCPAVKWFNGTQPAYYDGANCHVANLAAFGKPFIHSNSYYITPKAGPSCPISLCKCPAGSFDGANCYIVAKPATGFIWQNGFYQKAGPGNSCPSGWGFDGANCMHSKAPWGTQAFEYQGAYYTTRLPYCQFGNYDGANCWLGVPPAGRKPFIYNGAFYYQ